jgi:maltose O-acetyltransferase
MNPSSIGHQIASKNLSDAVLNLSSLARARVSLRGTERGARIRCYGRLEVERGGSIRIGQRVTFLAGLVPTSLRCQPGGELVVGDRTICNYGAALIAKRSVRIGSDCMIASYVHICDDDGRRSGPVVIGDGVWIAHGAVIEPETVIGEGSVISALAVVSGVVPPNTLVAGNPAQFVVMHPSGAEPVSVEEPSMEPSASDGAPSAAEVRRAVIEWLDDTRCFGDAADRISADTMSLREAGLLDSLGLVQLVAALEKRFGTTIDRRRVARPEAQSIHGLLQCMTLDNGAGDDR